MIEQTLRVPFIDLTAQREPIADEINAAIGRVMANNSFILGQELAQFEEEFADYCEAAHAIGVDSGTSALELALRAYGIGPGDEVITAANTFIATAFAISYTGADVVLVDCDPYAHTLDVAQVEHAITDRTKAIIPVHLYGQPVDMDPITMLARKHDLIVIEDACQAHGARYKGRRVGSLGHAAAFSFYPAKNLGAYGDGGMVVTNDTNVMRAIRMMRDYGQSQKYHHDRLGYNRRLDTLQAAVLRVKLHYLDEWNKSRQDHARLYTTRLGGNGIRLPIEANYSEAVWHLYVIHLHDRDALRDFLSKRDISTGLHYPVPIHMQQAYQHLPYVAGDFPQAERSAADSLSLPMYAEMTTQMIEWVVDSIKAFLAQQEVRRSAA